MSVLGKIDTGLNLKRSQISGLLAEVPTGWKGLSYCVLISHT
jgi:hypothetical protein